MISSPLKELDRALQAEESDQLGSIIRGQKREHFEALRRLASGASGVNEAHRQKALYALGRWGDTNVVEDIVQILPELGEVERITAIDALGRLGTKKALDAILDYEKDSSAQVRKVVVEACSRIGGSRAEARLRSIAKRDSEAWLQELARKRVKHQSPTN